MSNGFGLFAGALSRAVTEALGGATEGELEALHITRTIRRGQMEEQLFPYQLGAAKTEAADLPGRMEHERARRAQERLEWTRPKVSISGDYAARVTPEGGVTWERRPLSDLERELETYQTEETRRFAQLPGHLRTALQTAEQRKGGPLTLDEQLQIGLGFAPDFKTRTEYLRSLTGLEVARQKRAAAEVRVQYWQARQQAKTEPMTKTIETPGKPADALLLKAYQGLLGETEQETRSKYPKSIPSAAQFGRLLKQRFLARAGLPPTTHVEIAWQPPAGGLFGVGQQPGYWKIVALRLPPTRRVERTYRGAGPPEPSPEEEGFVREDFAEPTVETAEQFLSDIDLP